MPSNFTKNLDTVSPSIEVNELNYDTSVSGMADSLIGAMETVGKVLQEKKDAEDMGSFFGDLTGANQNIERLRDEAELERLQMIKMRDEALYDEDTSNDARALEIFNREIERINLRERQQGIILDSNKRAVVRRWLNARPDMAPAFTQALTMDKAIREMRSTNPDAEILNQWNATRQEALAKGTTVGYLQSHDGKLRRAASVAADVEIAVNSGKMNQGVFDVAMMTAVDAEMSGLISNVIMPLAKRARAGNAQAVMQIREVVARAEVSLMGVIAQQKVAIEGKTGELYNDQFIINYVRNTLNNYGSMYTTGDIQNLYSIERMAEDKTKVNAWAAYIPWLPPEIAEDVGPRILINAIEGSGRFLSILSDPKKGLGSLARGDIAGDPQARQAMMLLRVFSEDMAKTFEGLPISQDSNAVLLMNALVSSLRSGKFIDPALADQAGPIVAAIYANAATDPTLPPQIRNNARDGLISNTVQSYNNFFGESDIMNPGSQGARSLQALTEQEWNNRIQPIAVGLERTVGGVDPTYYAAVKMDTSNPDAPFMVDPSVVVRLTGRADAAGGAAGRTLRDAVDEMNKYYRMITATRPGGVTRANQWAFDYYNRTFAEAALPQLEEITITPEDMEKFRNGN